jgi:uncharacterized protein (TIGR03435 family)
MTGLYGDYQMTLDLPFPGASTVATAPGAELPAALESEGVSLFSTVDRLGLKLEHRKTPIEVLVDNVNRIPAEN